MGHIERNVEVLIGFGNDVGSAFNTVLRHTFRQQGLGMFCMTGFSIPDGTNVTEGMNATIQVLTNGDPNGGLYACADITFSSTALAPGSGVCTNGTGVSDSTASISGNPNETTPSATSTSASPSETSKGTAALLNARLGGFAIAGVAALAIML